MENIYGICRIAVAPLRADPNNSAEMVTQLLFGDNVEVLDSESKWWLVRNGYDGYEGWVDFRQIALISKEEFAHINACKLVAPLSFNNIVTAEDGSSCHLSAGSNLPHLESGICKIGEERFKVEFDAHQNAEANFKKDFVKTAKFFQNIPYLWGGRNIFGLDCSGFVQLVFKMFSIRLKRDAFQQAEQGNLVGFLAECKPGDVAFFDNDEGRIIHVGMLLSPNEIIHASSKVRIDPIDDQGIFNKELRKYTHKLRIIKRFGE